MTVRPCDLVACDEPGCAVSVMVDPHATDGLSVRDVAVRLGWHSHVERAVTDYCPEHHHDRHASESGRYVDRVAQWHPRQVMQP